MISRERRSRGEKTALASLSPRPSYLLYSANLFAASVGGGGWRKQVCMWMESISSSYCPPKPLKATVLNNIRLLSSSLLLFFLKAQPLHCEPLNFYGWQQQQIYFCGKQSYYVESKRLETRIKCVNRDSCLILTIFCFTF